MNIIKEIESIIYPIAANENVEIVDIEYVKEDKQKVLRIFINTDNGVSLDLCTKMSHMFGKELDKIDPIKEEYVLEISSPGIDRILKNEKDFAKFKGFRIKLNTAAAINNQKNFKGNLVTVGNGKIIIDDLTNKIVEIEISNIVKAKVEPEI